MQTFTRNVCRNKDRLAPLIARTCVFDRNARRSYGYAGKVSASIDGAVVGSPVGLEITAWTLDR